MYSISSQQQKDFKDNGYLIIEGEEIIDIKKRLITNLKEILLEIITLSDQFDDNLKNMRDASFDDLMSYVVKNESNNEISRACYEIFPALPVILALNNEPLFLNVAKDLGVSIPITSTTPAIRIDRSKLDKYLSPPHQDYWSSMLSTNAIVIWFPLSKIDQEMGFLQVVPSSHTKGLISYKEFDGNWPFTCKDTPLKDELIGVDMTEDSVLIFSQMLIHQSGRNISDKTRVTVQLRYNDLVTQEKLTSSFTPQYSEYVKNKQERLLAEFKE